MSEYYKPRTLCLRCEKKATWDLQPSNGGSSWRMCSEHVDQAEKALMWGLPGASSGTGWVTRTKVRSR